MSDRTLRLLAGLDLPFLIVSRKIGEERALELMHAGRARLCESHAFDRFDEHRGRLRLLITDVVMPRMTGCELAEAFVARQPDFRVLFMSGYTDDQVLAQGVARSAGFLQKPFTPDVLARKVREVLDADGSAIP